MNIATLLEPVSAALVVGGTLIATVLRSGMDDCRAALRTLGGLRKHRFDGGRAKANLATQIGEIQQDGLQRADPAPSGDEEFDEIVGRIIATRAEGSFLDLHEHHRERRRMGVNRAIRTFTQAAELAPVFGLAATLISLSQLPANGIGRQAYMGAIGMAVAATLYGLLLANLIFMPIARAIERAAEDEERARKEIVDWLRDQIPSLQQRRKPAPVIQALAA
jgi:chemotaxis protein MotA